MALSFSQKFDILQTPSFKGAVSFALNKVGTNIMNDGLGASKLQYHVKRHALADGATKYPTTLADRFAFEVLANYNNDGTPSDGDIEYLITTQFNRIAGVTPADAQAAGV